VVVLDVRHPGVVPRATVLSLDDLRSAVADGSIDTVAIVTPDLQGKLAGKRVPADAFLDGLPAGIDVSSSIFVYDDEQNVNEGFPEIGEQNGWADMACVPDTGSLRRAPHLDRVAFVFGDLWWSPDRPVEVSPRSVLRAQCEAAAAVGLVPWAAVEYEFHLFADSFEQAHAKRYRDLQPLHATRQDYGIYRVDRDEELLGAVWRSLAAGGVPVESVKAEMGHGQYEVTFQPCHALAAADRALLGKLFTREIAAQRGLSATFMARLDHTAMGSSGHIHLSACSPDATNLFDPDDQALSALGRRFVGGIMRRAPEFMLLACPYVNSYKRLDPDNFVTAALDFGAESRTVPFRLCGHGRTRNIEYRIPGADANPYLVLAAMTAAGLEGIATGAEPLIAGSPEAARVGNLPDTLRDAIERWESSTWARGVFGDLVVDTIAVAERHEMAVFAREVSDIELRRGFEWA
jgi:glutamine synthetase